MGKRQHQKDKMYKIWHSIIVSLGRGSNCCSLLHLKVFDVYRMDYTVRRQKTCQSKQCRCIIQASTLWSLFSVTSAIWKSTLWCWGSCFWSSGNCPLPQKVQNKPSNWQGKNLNQVLFLIIKITFELYYFSLLIVNSWFESTTTRMLKELTIVLCYSSSSQTSLTLWSSKLLEMYFLMRQLSNLISSPRIGKNCWLMRHLLAKT